VEARLVSDEVVIRGTIVTAFLTGIVGVLGLEGRIESILTGNPLVPGMDLLIATAFLSVATGLWATFSSKREVVLRASLLSIGLGLLSAWTSQLSSNPSSGIVGPIQQLIHTVSMNAWSPLKGFSLALSGLCLYTLCRFDSQNRLLSIILLGLFVSALGNFAVVGRLTGIESLTTESILCGFCLALIGIVVIIIARQKLIVDPHLTNFGLMVLYCLLYGREEVQKEVANLSPLLKKL